MLRALETNLEPIPVGLEHTFRPFALGVRGSTRVAFSRPASRLASSSFVCHCLHSMMGLLQLLRLRAPMLVRRLWEYQHLSHLTYSMSLAAAVNTPIQVHRKPACSSAYLRVRLSLGKCSACTCPPLRGPSATPPGIAHGMPRSTRPKH